MSEKQENPTLFDYMPSDKIRDGGLLTISDIIYEDAINQRQLYQESGYPTVELRINFGEVSITTQNCKTAKELRAKVLKSMRKKEQERKKAKIILLKTPYGQQLQEFEQSFKSLNGEELQKAFEETTIQNILPLIDWFEKYGNLEERAWNYMEENNLFVSRGLFDLNLDAQRVEILARQKGFPSPEEWDSQTTYLVGDTPPVMDEKYAKLSDTEILGVTIVSFIQFLSRPGTSMSHFWHFTEAYKKAKAQEKMPLVVQKGHTKTLPIKPDTSRGERAGF